MTPVCSRSMEVENQSFVTRLWPSLVLEIVHAHLLNKYTMLTLVLPPCFSLCSLYYIGTNFHHNFIFISTFLGFCKNYSGTLHWMEQC